jgi:ubiquinone/menaquinone biosynthesis C-methylase UbiE
MQLLITQPTDKTRTDHVRLIFNEMADEYDNLNDLWYRHTFGFIDNVISQEFIIQSGNNRKPVALDIGCGTGIQSLRLASMGYKVIGIDIADNLLEIARKKLATAGYTDAEFHNINAESLPFEDSIADCVNCCGPTLSFVQRWDVALREMSRCLKPGGKLCIEVEGKWNFDIFWEVVNALAFNLFKYDEPLSKALSHLLPPWNVGHYIDYSFKLESGESVTMPLKLFAASELKSQLRRVGIIQDKRWGLHVITNLIPSTVLHEANPSKEIRTLFKFLASIESRLNAFWPFNAFGCSLLVVGHKQSAQEN